MIQDDYGNLVDAASYGSLNARLDAGDKRMTRIEDELSENTKLTAQLATNTADIVEFFAAMQGAFKVLNWIGRLAKPIGVIAAAAASIAGAVSVLKGAK